MLLFVFCYAIYICTYVYIHLHIMYVCTGLRLASTPPLLPSIGPSAIRHPMLGARAGGCGLCAASICRKCKSVAVACVTCVERLGASTLEIYIFIASIPLLITGTHRCVYILLLCVFYLFCSIRGTCPLHPKLHLTLLGKPVRICWLLFLCCLYIAAGPFL